MLMHLAVARETARGLEEEVPEISFPEHTFCLLQRYYNDGCSVVREEEGK